MTALLADGVNAPFLPHGEVGVDMKKNQGLPILLPSHVVCSLSFTKFVELYSLIAQSFERFFDV